jgi:hypothetical protein
MQRLRLIKMDVEGAEPPILRHLLDQLSIYPPSMDIVVEASPDDDPAAWRDVFERLRDAGFTAWAIENDYELDWYLRWRRPTSLQRVDVMPARQQDLLFTRRDVPLAPRPALKGGQAGGPQLEGSRSYSRPSCAIWEPGTKAHGGSWRLLRFGVGRSRTHIPKHRGRKSQWRRPSSARHKPCAP